MCGRLFVCCIGSKLHFSSQSSGCKFPGSIVPIEAPLFSNHVPPSVFSNHIQFSWDDVVFHISTINCWSRCQIVCATCNDLASCCHRSFGLNGKLLSQGTSTRPHFIHSEIHSSIRFYDNPFPEFHNCNGIFRLWKECAH